MISTDIEASDFFVVGGNLRPDAPSYVQRPADKELFGLTLAGRFGYVLTPRQMGKSSLMVRTAQRLRAQGVRTATVDLQQLGTTSSAEQWYFGFITRLRSQLRLSLDMDAWWAAHASLPPVQSFIEFLRDVVLQEIDEPVVIFVDEIDTTLNLDFSDDFFSAIRFTYNERATDPAYRRLTFVLLGVATPTDLIQDRNRTPFNIGQEIDLHEFSRSDAQVLEQHLTAIYPERGQALYDRIYHWTNGHPYLTQKLCAAVAERRQERWTTERVDELVEEVFLSEGARRETNLQRVRDNVDASPQKRRLLTLYRRVYTGRQVPEMDRSLIHNRLKLYGLVRAEGGVLQVRNEIYRHAFDLEWIKENMPVDWARRVAILSTVLLLVVATVFGVWFSRQQQQEVEAVAQAAIDEFRQVPSADVRITDLAVLFQLEGYQGQAQDLFFGELAPEEQVGLFEQVTPAVGNRLITATHGLYVYAGIRNDTQGNALLDAMGPPLRELGDPSALNLASEIDLWRRGRDYATEGQYGQAIVAYEAAMSLNDRHPGTHFDRALAYADLGDATAALGDLAKVLDLGAGWETRVASAIVSDGQLFSTFTPLRGTYPRLAALVPTPTSTPTPTDTPTFTPTPTHTPVPTVPPTAMPTDTPLPTDTPVPTVTHTNTPTATATATNTRRPTSTPSPTPSLLPAPTLLAPADGASFTGWDAQVILRWSSVGTLAADEYYVVRIPYDSLGGVDEFWRKETSLQVPSHYSLGTVGFADRHYDWSVQVMRCTANCDKVLDDSARKQGVAVGSRSPERVFYWHPGIAGKPGEVRPLTPTPP